MFPSAEYVLAAELIERRERIANDFASVGRVRRVPRRRFHTARLGDTVHTAARRLRRASAAAH